ncbi:ROK family protein [Limosilactobacillus sp.]|uniref:ROK family protein n=1 Tax=Limosilactobacillus sp. TaxID=2773925 RepID=UPI00345E0B63
MSKNYLAFDVGGTSIKYALMDSDLNFLERGKALTNHNKNHAIITNLTTISADLAAKYDIAGIGVSTAGRVGQNGEIVFSGPTIQDYQGTQIKRVLEKESQLPVHVLNDVDAALRGEIFCGAGKLFRSIYCIALGTGIGGSFYIDHHLVDGAHNLGNSVGYLDYDPADKSTFESHYSTLAFERQLSTENISVPDAFAKARQGNQHYLQLIDQWCDQIGKRMAQICLILDPEAFLIGGAVSQQGDFFTGRLAAATKKYMPDGMFHVQIKPAMLQDRSQLFGAVADFIE